jgi:hypothetical protein
MTTSGSADAADAAARTGNTLVLGPWALEDFSDVTSEKIENGPSIHDDFYMKMCFYSCVMKYQRVKRSNMSFDENVVKSLLFLPVQPRSIPWCLNLQSLLEKTSVCCRVMATYGNITTHANLF